MPSSRTFSSVAEPRRTLLRPNLAFSTWERFVSAPAIANEPSEHRQIHARRDRADRLAGGGVGNGDAHLALERLRALVLFDFAKEHAGSAGTKALGELETELTDDDLSSINPVKQDDETKIIEDAPVTKIVATILRYAVEGNASDVHVEPMKLLETLKALQSSSAPQ
jgi:type II secretory ATPase GspE/PulE/Tfp pilus assembly ATPase PilB-like protein